MVPVGEGHHTQIVKGLLDMCLLSVIVEEPSYGYGMVQRLNDYGWVITNENSFYPVLKRLQKQGLIESELVPSTSGPARKYYSATTAGNEMLDLWVTDWRSVRDGVDAVLDGRKPEKKKSKKSNKAKGKKS